MEAMDDNLEIRIRYRKYTGTEISEYTLRPYAVKESARRWYIVAYCVEREGMRVYGMDRIVSMEVTGRHFVMPDDFDVDALFRNSFGVYLPDSRPEERKFSYLFYLCVPERKPCDGAFQARPENRGPEACPYQGRDCRNGIGNGAAV